MEIYFHMDIAVIVSWRKTRRLDYGIIAFDLKPLYKHSYVYRAELVNRRGNAYRLRSIKQQFNLNITIPLIMFNIFTAKLRPVSQNSNCLSLSFGITYL